MSKSIALPASQQMASTARLLESMLHALVNFVDTRQLDRSTNTVFDNVLDPYFSARSGPPALPRKLGADDYIAYQKQIIATYPAVQVLVKDWDMVIDEKVRTADILANYEVTGQAVGVVRKCIAGFRVRR